MTGDSWTGDTEDPHPHEPDEPDPLEDLGPGVPEAPDPTASETEVPASLLKTFWWLVLVFNVSLLALSLGVMFVVFEGRLRLGGQLVLGGALLFAYGYYRYRAYEAD